MTKAILIIWLSVGQASSTMTTLKFDTVAECEAAEAAIALSYNRMIGVFISYEFGG
jgi:hypothetical protein